jgi:hypothetical protein
VVKGFGGKLRGRSLIYVVLPIEHRRWLCGIRINVMDREMAPGCWDEARPKRMLNLEDMESINGLL